MKQAVVPSLALTVFLLSATSLHAEPALITEPDYSDPFTVVAEPRGNPNTLGTRTRDGYPVFPTRWGGVTCIEQRGERIPVPLCLPGFSVPVVTAGPPGQEIPNIDVHDHPAPVKSR
ncbi:MAG: hypothetical protein LBT65_05560 [Synergistaceae bacterium]|jgi:hypothetical protein|nr:hypothetical protein [Synergistaceae bacterium]